MTETRHEERSSSSAQGETQRRARPRTCVGCGRPDAREAFVRLVLGPGVVAVDPGDGGFGRGAHVHPRPDCIARAASGGLARAAKSQVRVASADGEPSPMSPAALSAAIAAAAHRRIAGLLGAAKRAKHAALGTRAVEAACREGSAALVVVATDAAAAADLAEVRKAVADGRAVAWSTKREIAAILRPRASADETDEGIAVVAVTDDRLAAALKETMVTLDACAATRDARPGNRRSGAGGGGPSNHRGRKTDSNPTERGA
jgi:predicted RNA-binding protein YlxR (DUF448 family)/ribosomal protein L7Ae-like RNA K-turn-binding protein